MKYLVLFLLTFTLIGCGSGVLDNSDRIVEGGDVKVTEAVSLDNKKAETPSAWQEKPPVGEFRHAVFELSPAPGDSKGAEIIIYKGIGGDAKQNIDRWKGQFQPPKGKTIDEVAKVTNDLKVAGFPASCLDISGTYAEKARPMAKNAINRPDYRMIAYHIEGKQNNYHIRFLGPAKTVARHEKEFQNWLDSFQ